MTRPAHEPLGQPAVRKVGITIGIVLLLLAILFGYELWAELDEHHSTYPLAPHFFSWTSTLSFGCPWIVVGIILCFLGVYCIVLAALPRKHTHVHMNLGMDAPQSVWTQTIDVERILRAEAITLSGISDLRVHARTTRRGDLQSISIKLFLVPGTDEAELIQRVHERTHELLHFFDTTPDVRIDAHVSSSSPASHQGDHHE